MKAKEILNENFRFWENVKMYDLTQKLSHLTPPWPTYEPLQVKFLRDLHLMELMEC